jgi:hypothetical protein
MRSTRSSIRLASSLLLLHYSALENSFGGTKYTRI